MPRIGNAPRPLCWVRPRWWTRSLIRFGLPRMVAVLASAAGAAASTSADVLSKVDAPALVGGHRHAEPGVLAPGYADLTFDPPTPGSYRLPPLGAAADARVLDADGAKRGLHELMGDRVVVLSFIYTRCGDVNGCPLATHVFGRVAAVLAATPELSDRVNLISLSFDPDHDTPAVMKAYGELHHREEVSWQFITTAGPSELDPLLEDYDQWVIRDSDAEGNPLGTISHVLRVYLIDRAKRIRNIYSVSYLHADTVASDIRTLLME